MIGDRLPVGDADFDADFDVATCQQGLQFFSNPAGAAERDAPRTPAGLSSCDRGLGRDRRHTAVRSARTTPSEK
jgi:hypothetical protein